MLRFAALVISASLIACSSSTALPTTPTADAATTDTSIIPGDSGGGDSGGGDAAPAPCKTNINCVTSTAGKTCDLATGKCVECTKINDTCPAAEHCDATTNKCVAGCKSDDGCKTEGDAGGVGKSRCDVAANTCVECLTDPDCPAGYLCSGKVCSVGCSVTKACAAGQTCCSGACVDTRANSDHCGTCGTKCMVTGATAKCEAGRCAIDVCPGTTADCDKDITNVCEVDLSKTLAHCGACGKTCPFVVNGLPACVAGKCDATCDTGFGNCDSDVSNGCETNILTNATNCGTCGNVCPSTITNGRPVCSTGKCTAVCNAGYGDCDKNLSNGCEASITSDPKNCGGCGVECALLPNATATCGTSACIIASCSPNYGNCDGVVTNGCESNLPSDPNNCGLCGRTCALANATNGCASGTCTIASCTAPFKDCNALASDGCEVNTNGDRNNCGACGNVCPTGESCVAGICKFAPSVVYSDSFTGGVASTSTQCSTWNTFRSSISSTTTYSKVTIRGSRDPIGVSCTGPSANTLCQAVRAGTTLSAIACDGRSWKVGPCNTSSSIEISANGDTCSCSSGYIARPCILHRDWGGVSGTTCNAVTQTLEVVCE